MYLPHGHVWKKSFQACFGFTFHYKLNCIVVSMNIFLYRSPKDFLKYENGGCEDWYKNKEVFQSEKKSTLRILNFQKVIKICTDVGR